jgi:PAS domain S-box-containing protein
MPELEILILIGIWLLLVIVKRLALKKGDLDIILFVFAVGAKIAFGIFELYPVDHSILDGAIYAGFALTLFFFSVSELGGQERSATKYEALKKEHKQVLTSYESLRKRYIATLELLKDGMAFRSDDGMMFGTNPFIELIGFDQNEFSQIEFEKGIHPEDIGSYKSKLTKLSKKKSNYEMTYRFKKGPKYIWIKENGMMIEYEDRMMIISMNKAIDVKLYPDSEVEVLNQLRIDYEFYEYLQSLNRLKVPYRLVFFELSNIPRINKKYGRDIGDLLMGEFINKIRFNFVKDEKSLFRLSGIRFAMVMKDDRKYDMLERALKHGGDLLNFEMVFGNVKQSVFPYFGIQKISIFDEPIDEMVDRTHKALDIALSDDHQENFFIIR